MIMFEWPSSNISLKFIPKGPTNNKSSLDQLFPGGTKPLHEPMLIHIFVAIWCP